MLFTQYLNDEKGVKRLCGLPIAFLLFTPE